MKFRFKAAAYILIISTAPLLSLICNAWNLVNLKLPKYFVNPPLLSGTLLLYDRPFFFESREIQIKTKDSSAIITLPFDLSTPGYNSYLHRRLFRFAADNRNCGIDHKKAFNLLFCESKLSILQNASIAEVSVNFTPHLTQGEEKHFHQACD